MGVSKPSRWSTTTAITIVITTPKSLIFVRIFEMKKIKTKQKYNLKLFDLLSKLEFKAYKCRKKSGLLEILEQCG